MKLWLICLIATIGFIQADKIGPPAFAPNPLMLLKNEKPFGAYYCQARCLASCLETYLAISLDECQKFCPPFGDNMPCPADNEQCWLTCGVPPSPNDQPAPESPVLEPVTLNSVMGAQLETNPFVIELSWNAVPNASLYIVEFFPRNRVAKPGESNFFQVTTTLLTYTVRKQDECTEYSGRVIAVNSYGISVPTYAFIGAPVPAMNNKDHFSLRNMQRDPWDSNMVTVTIDYTFPFGWPVDDIDIDTLKVTASDCTGTMGDSFGPQDDQDTYQPGYDALIGKSPTAAIQLSFNSDVVQSNCLFQMRVSALTTRCNSSVTFDQDMSAAPGISFRINCANVEGICDNDTSSVAPPEPLLPVPVPSSSVTIDPDVVVPPISSPGHMPIGVDKPDDTSIVNLTIVTDTDDMPTPPPLPLFIIGQSEQMPNVPVQPMPPGASVSIVDLSPNGTSVETIAVIPQTMLPPLCDLDMIDVDPTLSTLSNSLIDMRVLWLEHQPLPPPPPATYFSIRYGPIIRKLVDDNREPSDIIPGYETIVRTGQQQQPDPTREISIPGVQRGTLMKIQICAIFDPNSEPFIQWDTVPNRRIDLAALEPFLDLELENNITFPQEPSIDPIDIQNAIGSIASDVSPVSLESPFASPPSVETPSSDDMVVDVPLVIAIQVEPKESNTYWLTVAGCGLLIVLTFMLMAIFLRRLCLSRRHLRKIPEPEKHMIVVSTVPTPPKMINDVVKTPLP